MTLDEAIQHCEEKAECGDACGQEHKQLADWLKELKQARENGIKEEFWLVCKETKDKGNKYWGSKPGWGVWTSNVAWATHFKSLGAARGKVKYCSERWNREPNERVFVAEATATVTIKEVENKK